MILRKGDFFYPSAFIAKRETLLAASEVVRAIEAEFPENNRPRAIQTFKRVIKDVNQSEKSAVVLLDAKNNFFNAVGHRACPEQRKQLEAALNWQKLVEFQSVSPLLIINTITISLFALLIVNNEMEKNKSEICRDDTLPYAHLLCFTLIYLIQMGMIIAEHSPDLVSGVCLEPTDTNEMTARL